MNKTITKIIALVILIAGSKTLTSCTDSAAEAKKQKCNNILALSKQKSESAKEYTTSEPNLTDIQKISRRQQYKEITDEMEKLKNQYELECVNSKNK